MDSFKVNSKDLYLLNLKMKRHKMLLEYSEEENVLLIESTFGIKSRLILDVVFIGITLALIIIGLLQGSIFFIIIGGLSSVYSLARMKITRDSLRENSSVKRISEHGVEIVKKGNSQFYDRAQMIDLRTNYENSKHDEDYKVGKLSVLTNSSSVDLLTLTHTSLKTSQYSASEDIDISIGTKSDHSMDENLLKQDLELLRKVILQVLKLNP